MGKMRPLVSSTLVVSAVLAVGWSLAAFIGLTTFAAEADRVDEHFRRNAKDHASAIVTGVEAHLEVVRVLGDFLAVHQPVEREQFGAFARSLARRHDSIQALEWAPRVTRSERDELVARARSEVAGFELRSRRPDGGWAPSPVRDVSYPVFYVEPLRGNEDVLGFDPVDQPAREQALNTAAAHARLVASAPMTLIQVDPPRPAILVFVPVFRAGPVPATATARRAAVTGFAEGVFLVGELFENALAMLEPAGQDMELWDLAGQGTLLHEHLSRRAGTGDSRWHFIQGRQEHRSRFEVGGRQWEIVVRPHTGFYFYDTFDSLLMSATVALLTLVLAVFSGSVVRREQEIREVVRKRTRQLSYQATHDTLTGLPNRAEFEVRLLEALQRCRATGETMSLCYLDLDQFKVVNDTSGHAAGDELLRHLGPMLASGIRDGDVLARLGGDEFGLLFRGCDVDVARRLAERLLDVVGSYRFAWKNRIFTVGASIGLVRLDAHTESSAAALSRADAACYIAKEKGRGRVHVFAPGDHESEHFRREIEWVSELRLAMKEDRLELWQQPLWSIRDLPAGPEGREILIRMRSPDGAIIPPGSFLPAAERFQMMVDVDRWVVERAVREAARLSQSDPTRFWSINLSGQSLNDGAFGDFVLSVIRANPVDARRLCFEITETALVTNLAQARLLIDRLRAEGCRFALDDFGSGMSSFAYLKNLPVDFLKIDGSFVRGLADDHMDREIVRAIHAVSAQAGIRTVAESVESESVLRILSALSVDLVQGFHIGRPEPLTTFEAAADGGRARAGVS